MTRYVPTPLIPFFDFIQRDLQLQREHRYDELRLCGFVIEVDYRAVRFVTNDSFRVNVDGIGIGDFLLMVPDDCSQFVLLRVTSSAETPKTADTQTIIFEMSKRAVTEVDWLTDAELSWSALEAQILGVFDTDDFIGIDMLKFAGDVDNLLSPSRYRVYAPDEPMLNDHIVNLIEVNNLHFQLGLYRPSESSPPNPDVRAFVSSQCFLGSRTALFGKTRLGKSNIVKMIASGLMEGNPNIEGIPRAGIVIFDINGEYSNDNAQDNGASLASLYPERCIVYALTPKNGRASRSLRMNFYLHPQFALEIVRSLLARTQSTTSNYVQSLLSVDMPNPDDLDQMQRNLRIRAKRKILMLWAILHRAGFPTNPMALLMSLGNINPSFSTSLRERLYDDLRADGGDGDDPFELPEIQTLDQLADELERVATLAQSEKLYSSSRKPLFDPDDMALLGFLKPRSSTASGPSLLSQTRRYHDQNSGNFVNEILAAIDEGKTVILDLSNAPEEVASYFSEYLARAIFHHRMSKFVEYDQGNLDDVVLIFEESHNLFPRESNSVTIYNRIAKEGAKYHLAIVYSTQSPTSIDRDLLAQTENFFVLHLSARDDVNALSRVNIAFEPVAETLLRTRSVGYVQMLTRLHRYVVPVQAHEFGRPLITGEQLKARTGKEAV